MNSGEVVAIHVRSGHRQPMQSLEEGIAISDQGLQGDYKGQPGSARQVLVMDRETLDNLHVEPGMIRENLTLQGIPVASLQPGQVLFIGDEVTLEVTGPCAPCSRMDEIRSGLQQSLQGRRGTHTMVLNGGTLKVGDQVRVEP